MYEKPTPESVVDHDAWEVLQDIDENGRNLTEWEIEFVESMTRQLKDSGRASKAQMNQLLRIQGSRIRE